MALELQGTGLQRRAGDAVEVEELERELTLPGGDVEDAGAASQAVLPHGIQQPPERRAGGYVEMHV